MRHRTIANQTVTMEPNCDPETKGVAMPPVTCYWCTWTIGFHEI
jgi:hypothetical protein